MATTGRLLLKDIRFLVTQDSERRIREHVDLLVEGQRIVRIGEHLQADGADVIDCSRRIVMPGLINTHCHLGMSLLRGFSDDKQLKEWLEGIIPEEQRIGEEGYAQGARIGILEALRTGTTTIVEMYGSITPAIAAAQELGIRMVAYLSYYTAFRPVASEDISLPPPPSSRITVGIGPHSIYGTDEPFLRGCRTYADAHHAPITLHLSETRQERAEFKEKTSLLPVEHLERIGFLGPDVLLSHCVWLTKGELDILAKHGCKVSHCAQSNMKLAGGGVMPLREMRERGIVVSLGTDSVASNNSLDMFREMHTCALLHKHHYWDATAAAAQEVLDLATLGGARALGMPDLGSLEEGKLSDLITLDLGHENLVPCSRDRVVSHLVYAANGMNVAEVVVDGTLLLRDGRFPSSAASRGG